MATSMSGTKPYIAPEIFDCVLDLCIGYSYSVDWWSLGIVAYEMLRGIRPFDIHSATSIQDVKIIFQLGADYPKKWSEEIIEVLSKLLCVSPGLRVSRVEELKQLTCLQNFDMDMVFKRRYKPYFTPPKDHLNCDPTFELEEMIIETKPLHKKKKRLAKQRSIREIQAPSIDLDADSPLELQVAIIPEFKVYNRYQELERRERELKEKAWEQELQDAMSSSDPLHAAESKGKLDMTAISTCDITPLQFKLDKGESIAEEMEENQDINKCQLQLPIKDNLSRSEHKFDDVNDIHNIDYIDRTPSPVDPVHDT